MAISRDVYIDQASPIEADLLGVFHPGSALVIFDIGSCEGEDSIRYARLFPNATIYAVEPLEANLRRIHANLERYRCPGIRVVPCAFSDAGGSASFYVSSGRPPQVGPEVDWDFGNKSSSLLAPDQHLVVHPWVRFDEVVEVPTQTLTDFCAGEKVTDIDLIHLDVQGAELKVLSGGLTVLERTKLIWLEVERVQLYAGQPFAHDVERFMTTHGFRLARQQVGPVAGDQLWVNRRLISGPWRVRRVRGRLAAFARKGARKTPQAERSGE